MGIQKIATANLHPVDPKKIDDSPGPFCMSFGFEPDPLIRSIEAVGLINPPLVMQNGENCLVVIAGYRRIQALKSLRIKKIPCRVLPEMSRSAMECLLLNLYDNLVSRKLNDVEKGMVLNRLSLHLPRMEIIKHYMPLLGLPSHEETLRLYMALETDLGTEMKLSLARGQLSLQAAKMLLHMSAESRPHVFRFMDNIKFNMNQQKQFFDFIVDIAHMENMSIPDVLSESSLERVRSDSRTNNPQKARAVLQLLHSRCLPGLAEAEKKFRSLVAGLDLPKGVRIEHPPFFEAPHYRLELLFKQGRELKEKITHLHGIEGLDKVGSPWEGNS